MQPLYLLLGSNCGNRAEYIGRAKLLVGEMLGSIEQSSAIYETAPWGNVEQQHFLNQAIMLKSAEEPHHILQVLKSIEREVGRTTSTHWGPREIDIDILLYGNVVLQCAKLNIPHAELRNRRFALTALRDVAADVTHPVLNKTIVELLDECTDDSEVTQLLPEYGL
jgi:2-amino-4-hydroxy-6-hydroxymethyldihydropteridine diphosphokinase